VADPPATLLLVLLVLASWFERRRASRDLTEPGSLSWRKLIAAESEDGVEVSYASTSTS
jgi:hypothetical protein